MLTDSKQPLDVVERYLDEETPAIQRAVMAAIPNDEPAEWLFEPMRDYPGRPAKHLRPALCLATCRAFGGHDEDVLASAVAIELLHNLFLVHDDVADASELRRGKPTLHTRIGVPLALTAAGGLGVLAYAQLYKNYPHLGTTLSGQVADEFLSMLMRTMKGQAIELGWIRDTVSALEPHDYLHMVAHKTCWYTTIHPMRVGGIIGAWGSIDPDRFVQFGLHLGAVFQIQDDILNLEGEESTYGKETLGDLREGKRTLMLIHLLRTASGADRAAVDHYLGLEPEERGWDVALQIRDLMRRYGSIEYAKAYGSEIAAQARAAFEYAFADAKPGRDADFVSALIPYMLERAR